MRESYIEKVVCNHAKDLGWLVYKWVSPGGGLGLPDRILLRKGEILFIEFKAPGRKPRPAQAAMHRKLANEGFKVLVIDNIEEGKRAVER